MKKKVLLFASSAVLIASTAVFATKSSAVKSLMEMNVEALAEPGIGGFGPMCSKTGHLGSHYMKYCSACNGTYDYYDMDVVAFCNN